VCRARSSRERGFECCTLREILEAGRKVIDLGELARSRHCSPDAMGQEATEANTVVCLDRIRMFGASWVRC
jgi:hypothetical protein